MNILNDLEELIIKHNVIGISVSGGLDSTLMAYLLHDIKYKLNTETKFMFFCVDRPDDSIVHAKRIVSYIDKKFNQEASPLYIVGDGTAHHSEQVKTGMREAAEKYDFDILVTAITKNPESLCPPVLLDNYVYHHYDGCYNGPVRIKPKNPKFLAPFWDITKRETVAIIKQRKLFDIPNITHTCTTLKHGSCGKCWQCCERSWAFKENDFIDTGLV